VKRKDLVDQPADHCEGYDYKECNQKNGSLYAAALFCPRVHHPKNGRKKNPADQIVEHGRRHDDCSHFASEQVEIHKDFGDYGKSGDGKSGSNKKRKDEAIGAQLRSQKLRKCGSRTESKAEWNEHAQKTHEKRASPLPEDAAQIDFEAGGQEKEDNAECSDRVEYDGHRAGGWE
jgi:hypothetical protein